MSPLYKAVFLFLKTAVFSQDLLSQRTKLVVGVSGGPDSLALLHVMTRVVDPARLVVAHLNHGYRTTAVSEAEFVQDMAKKWGVVCETDAINVSQIAKITGDSLEEAGRKARYEFFCKVADVYETPYIVVGHHGDDQAETVLMNLLRGTGLRGLRGMLPVTSIKMTKHDRYFVLRPFLSVNRQDIEDYCQINELSPVFDESNEDISFFRNRIRQDLLPLLTDYNPGIRSHLQQLAELSTADVALLDGLVDETWTRLVRDIHDSAIVIDRKAWSDLPLSLRRLMLRRAVVEKRPFLQDISFQAIELARLVAEKNESGQRVSLPGELFLIVDYDRLVVTGDPFIALDDWPQRDDGVVTKISVPGKIELANGWVLEAKFIGLVDIAEIRADADPWKVFVALPAEVDLFVRTRIAGERFQPLGMNGRSVKVKDVMINRKIGAMWRDKWPIVATSFHLVWIVGQSIDERMKITEEKPPILQLHCYKG